MMRTRSLRMLAEAPRSISTMRRRSWRSRRIEDRSMDTMAADVCVIAGGAIAMIAVTFR
jgi:hypothetical protein